MSAVYVGNTAGSVPMPLVSFRREALLKPEGKAAHAAITVFLTYLGNMVAACCPQLGTLSCFSESKKK